MPSLRRPSRRDPEPAAGWWQDSIFPGNPMPYLRKVRQAAYDGRTMAHVMVDQGWYPDLATAREKGWNKPVTPGLHAIDKTRIVEVLR